MELTEKDEERLRKVKRSIENGTAATYDKPECIKALESILDPKCSICRKSISEDICIVNERKMHQKCKGRYKGK